MLYKTSYAIEGYEEVDFDIITLKKIIIEICELHKKFWDKHQGINDINLKKREVRDVFIKYKYPNSRFIDDEFFLTLRSYVQLLNFLMIDIEMEYTYEIYDFRIRAKQLESIFYKLTNYNLNKKEKGSISINKCLNDLFGFRAVIPHFNHYSDSFRLMFEELKDNYKIKYINSTKGNYKATHVYFYGETNKYFPWELQIWNPKDFKENHESHEIHKQEYTKAAHIYKKAVQKYQSIQK